MANLPGTKTFLQFQQEAAEICINQPNFVTGAVNPTNPNLARFKQFFNDSYREICARMDWWFLFDIRNFNTVVGQITPFAMPDDARELMYMTIPSRQQKLRKSGFSNWLINYPGRFSNVGNTLPWAYVEGERAANNALQYYLFPASDQIYTCEIGIKIRITDLVADADIMIIPPEFQNVAQNEAIRKTFQKINDNRWKEYDYMKKDTPAYELYSAMWLKAEQEDDYVNRFRNLDIEIGLAGANDINRELFVPF